MVLLDTFGAEGSDASDAATTSLASDAATARSVPLSACTCADAKGVAWGDVARCGEMWGRCQGSGVGRRGAGWVTCEDGM